jgi:hypothetical protein
MTEAILDFRFWNKSSVNLKSSGFKHHYLFMNKNKLFSSFNFIVSRSASIGEDASPIAA